MKYVKNNGRYAMSYTYMAGEKEVKVDFDRQRIYMDTGNIATTGITAVEDEAYKALCENKVFKADLDSKVLELTEKVTDNTQDELSKLKAENEKLQAKLNKDSAKKEMEKLEAEKAKLEAENADMKAKLEALAKPQADEAQADEAQADIENF